MAVVLADGEDHQVLAEQVNLLCPASHPDVPLRLGAQRFVLFKGIAADLGRSRSSALAVPISA